MLKMELQKIRWYQLRKQNLFPPSDDYLTVFQKNIGLHSTDVLTPYLSLWARVKHFEPQRLFDDFNVTRQAFRLRGFRGTLFGFHRTVLSDILATSKFYFETQLSQLKSAALNQQIDLSEMTRQLSHFLSGNQYLTSRELKKLFSEYVPASSFIYLMRFWEFNRNLGRAPERYLMDKTIRYGLLSALIADKLPGENTSEEALARLLLNYIKQFGPVCLEDICWWFPLKKSLARKRLKDLQPKLVEIS